MQNPLENIPQSRKELLQGTEEAFKILLLKWHPFYTKDGEDWLPFGKIDIRSPLEDMLIEVKTDHSWTAGEAIFQAVVTAVKERSAFNWYGCHTLDDMVCVPAWCIDTRLIALDVETGTLTPSTRNERWKYHYDLRKQEIADNMRDFPSLDERKEIIKAKELHAEVSDEDFSQLSPIWRKPHSHYGRGLEDRPTAQDS
jgi:hypothetical protein